MNPWGSNSKHTGWGAGGMAQVVEPLPTKHKALSSNQIPENKTKQNPGW
jgi:hypothetical protein